jgi:cell wall-associated NlpC family hydrolase
VLLVKLDSSTDPGAELARRAISLTGVRYKYGGTSPESGMDCSGLVRYVFQKTWEMDLPRTSDEISRVGRHIEMHDLQPGDLVFYNTLRRKFSHVGIYVGDNKFVHAPTAGGKVRVESMDLSYWKKRFDGACRISRPKRW